MAQINAFIVNQVQRFFRKLREEGITVDAAIEPIPFYPNAFVEDDPLVWEIKKEGVRLDDTLS